MNKKRIKSLENKDTLLSRMDIFKSDFKNLKDDNRIIKTIAVIAFTFIILSLVIVVKTPPSVGYEISIYGVYPWYFWVFVITSIFIGQMVLLSSAAASKINDNYWAIGFLGILITNTILLFMPFIRGYATYGRGDVLSHIGIIKDILNTASIGTNNFYPNDHILTASLSYITDISVEHAVNIVPPIFSLFYIFSIYIFIREIFGRKKEIRFVLMFASILLFSNGNFIFAPSVQSFFFLPSIFYFYFKSRGSNNLFEFNLILIISLFFIVFFHPMTTLFLILIFLILEFCLFIYKKINKTHIYELHNLLERRSYNIILFLFVTFFIWYFSFTAITNSFRKVTSSLLQKSGYSQAETYTELLKRTQPDFYDLIEVILNNYGQIIVLASLSLFFSIFIFNIWRKNPKNKELNFYHFFFSFGTIIFILLSIIFFYNDLIIGFGRVSKYTIFFSSLFVGLGFYLSFNRFELSVGKQRLKFVSLCVVLIILSHFSISNLYFSPTIKLSNQQVTKMEIKGMSWFFDHRNEEILTLEFGLSQSSFYSAIYGYSAPRKNLWLGKNAMPVEHFNYSTSASLGDYYKEPRYFTLNILGRIFYQEIYPKFEIFWKFTSEDFVNLENDKTILKIYNNGNLDIYFIE